MSTPLISFKKNIAGQKQVARGIPCGEHLVVSYAIGSKNTYQIWQIYNGNLFKPTVFTDIELAVSAAEWFDKTYQDYFCILESYPKADIVSLAKWSVHNGIKIYELLEQIKNEQVNKKLLSQAWDIANQREKDWIKLGVK